MSSQERKLNYLLVMPRLVRNVGDGYNFPLGLAYISGSLKKAGFNVTTVNLNHREGDVEELVGSLIREHDIDVVGTGSLSFQYNMVRKVVETAKRVKPGVVTIVGGGLITGDPEPAMTALEHADFGVIGEGELTIVELCTALERGGDLAAVDGIIYREGGAWRRTAPRREIDDIDDLAADYEGFDIRAYLATPPPGISGMNTSGTIFMLASRSCPYNCTFCFHSIGRKYRQRSLDSFFRELDSLVAKYDIRYISLSDELFTVNEERVREFCARMKGYGIKWMSQFRVDRVTPAVLPVLREGGCEIMTFGLESADNRILKSMNKHTTIEQIEKTLKMVYDFGMPFDGVFIFGDVAETAETAANTLRWWKAHPHYKITLNVITVYPGSQLYHYACEHGFITDRVQFLRDGCPQMNISQLSAKEYADILLEIMESPYSLTKPLANVSSRSVDARSGRFTITGDCAVCGTTNTWENVKLISASFGACKQCSQRYNLLPPPDTVATLEANLARLLEGHRKVAVWGVNYHVAYLIKNSPALRGERVFVVEISAIKRTMNLYGKTLHEPEVLEREGIDAVIIPIPMYLHEITERIRNEHRQVRTILDLNELFDPAFTPA